MLIDLEYAAKITQNGVYSAKSIKHTHLAEYSALPGEVCITTLLEFSHYTDIETPLRLKRQRWKPGVAVAAILVGRSLFLLPLVGRVAEKCYICRQLWQNTTTEANG